MDGWTTESNKRVTSAVSNFFFCDSLAVQTIEFDEGAGAVLRIQPLRAPRDENTYECVARNSEGEVSVTAKLAIIRGKRLTSLILQNPFAFSRKELQSRAVIFISSDRHRWM